MFLGYIYFLKKVCVGGWVCKMVFKHIVTFENYCYYEKVLWGFSGDIEKCIKFTGMFFKSV